MSHTKTPKIILASSSSYRKILLAKIIDNFGCASPNIDESRKNNESLEALSLRLAKEKAQALSEQYPKHLIIGSDQVACLIEDGQETQLNKPLNKENCFKQLKQCQNRTVQFFTSACVLNSATMHIQTNIDYYETKFRSLSDEQIYNYIEREPALDCAGGFKMEGLGIALFEHIRGNDPNSLIGLPLISLIKMLENEGVSIL